MEDFFPSQDIPSGNLRTQQIKVIDDRVWGFFLHYFFFVIFSPGFNPCFVRINLLSKFQLCSAVTNL